MKRIAAGKIGVFLLLAALIFTFAASAEAELQRFGNIEAYVPEGWTVQATGAQTTFMSPGNVAALSVLVNTATGVTAEEVAVAYSEAHYGTTPEEVDEGTFVFSFQNENGIESHAVVVLLADTDSYMVWVTAGAHPQLGELIESVQLVE